MTKGKQEMTLKESIFFIIPMYILLFANKMQAQDSTAWENVSNTETLRLFCDPGYITALGGIGNIEPIMFEADIKPYYMIGTTENNRWTIGLSPQIVIRMYNEESYPIRTPSYMPRIMLIHQVVNKEKQKDMFYYLSWFHFSNGQDGNFYNDDSITINTRSGDFYTNWYEGGIFFSRTRMRERYYMKFNVQYSYKQKPELNGLYGRLRFSGNFQSQFNLSKALRVISPIYFNINNIVINNDFRFGIIADHLQNVGIIDHKRLIFSYTVSFKPAYFRDVTLFAQYYYGQDYYNIYFNRILKVLRFGISAKTVM